MKPKDSARKSKDTKDTKDTTRPNKQKWSKYSTTLYSMIITLLFLSNYTSIFDEKIDMNGDNIHYYSLGTAIAQGKGFTNIMGFTESPHSHFPPGYPYFIALMMKLGFKSVHAIKVANGVLLFLSLTLAFFVFRHLCGNKLIAFAGTAFAASQITVLRFSTIMMSEMLFLFLSLTVFCAVRYLARVPTLFDAKKRTENILAMSLLSLGLICIYFVRTMGLSLILAVVVYYAATCAWKGLAFLKSRKNNEQPESTKTMKKTTLKYAILFGLSLFSLLLPRHAMNEYFESIGKTTIDYVGDFQNKTGGEKMETIADWSERLKNNSVTYLTKWIPSAVFNYTVDTNTKPSTKEWTAGIAVFLLILVGIFKLRETSLLMILYMGATLAVLLLWPEQYGGHRYMTPVIPFLIFLSIHGIYSLLGIMLKKLRKSTANLENLAKATAIIACLIFTIIAAPSYSKEIKRATKEAQFKDYMAANTTPKLVEYLDAIRWVRQNLPDTARVCTRKPELFHIYSGGRKSIAFPYYATPDEIMKYLVENNIQYIIIDRWFRHAYYTVMPAVQQNIEKFTVAYKIAKEDKNENPTYVLRFIP